MKIQNKVIISDPCYNRSTWCMTEQDNMLEGDYNYYVEELDDDTWGLRIKSIEIVHANYKRPSKWKFKNSLVGVDSGQAGIFCDSIYPLEKTGEYSDENSFYGKCCKLTSQNEDEVSIWYELQRDIKDMEIGVKSFKDLVRNYKYYKENVESLSSLENYLKYTKERFNKYYEISPPRQSWEEYEKESILNYSWHVERKWYHNRYEIYKKYLETGIMPTAPKLIRYGIIDDKGIVSSSGYGDGQYNCYVNFNKKGKCIGVKIKFI